MVFKNVTLLLADGIRTAFPLQQKLDLEALGTNSTPLHLHPTTDKSPHFGKILIALHLIISSHRLSMTSPITVSIHLPIRLTTSLISTLLYPLLYLPQICLQPTIKTLFHDRRYIGMAIVIQRQLLIVFFGPIIARVTAEFARQAFEDFVACVAAFDVVDFAPMAHSLGCW